VNGVIDENTLVWGQGLADWLPVRNVRTLVPQIRTVEGAKDRYYFLILYRVLLYSICDAAFSLNSDDSSLEDACVIFIVFSSASGNDND